MNDQPAEPTRYVDINTALADPAHTMGPRDPATGRFRHTYTLEWDGNRLAALEIAEWAAVAIATLADLQDGAPSLSDPDRLAEAMRQIAQLQRMLAAMSDELLWAARGVPAGATTATREPVLSWAQIAAARWDANRSTPQRRHEALVAGTRAEYAGRFPTRPQPRR